MENVTFVSKGSNRYSLQVEPENKVPDSFGVLHTISVAKLVSFDGGVFRTKDKDLIEAIRKTEAFDSGRVFELPSGARPPEKPKVEVIRGAVSSKTIHEEAGVKEPEEGGLSLKEKGNTECPDCGKQFKEDYRGAKLRMHKIGAHGSRKKG
ncbi:unnamed protein product [marine sediment metagenome]|uniref:Uncharacterized protein n=1 Tax=marine sediment metagenome TaxID=412755 RepID=X0YGD9_9ZZZZ